ncbi:membrane protease subunit HflK [Stella humosa]|uniref:Protein HflK n=2 Tax=Stella humosa TaxID=94 RepID=A0A3N1KL75_9PROT|nr:membrane protease subunit HflK [Stella humosa]BBK32499.1 protease modulator HflK [Stella humosa]
MPRGFGGGRGILVVVVVLALIWLGSGFYRVLPDEQGVVLRFGEFVKTTQPGLNYHLPTPIESVLTPKVTRVNRVEIGFRAAETVRGSAVRQIPEESLMLTGDENIVDINFTVFWVIRNAGEFLFNIRSPEQTVKAASESAVRESIGQIPIALALAEGRREIEQNTLRLLQEVLDNYKAGILITQVQLQKVDPPGPVIDAFRDVQRARADQERLRNEAEAYRNDIIPRARGEAERLIQESEAYKQEVVARSEGDAQRFISVYTAYKVAPDVTTQRIYLETMEDVLRGVNKVLIDKNSGGSGVVPYLPLPEIARRSGQPATPSTSSRTPTGGTTQ